MKKVPGQGHRKSLGRVGGRDLRRMGRGLSGRVDAGPAESQASGLVCLGRGRWQGQEIVEKPAQGRENT